MDSKAKLSLFLENNKNIKNNEAAYIFDDPLEIISASHPADVANALTKIEQKLAQGYHVAGWISYEAGLCFEGKLKNLLPQELNTPLIYMGVYERCRTLDSQSADHYWSTYDDKSAYELSNLKLSQDRESYERAFNKIQNYLEAGDIYQVNYTQKAVFDFQGCAEALYATLRGAQAVEYAAFIDCDELKVLSLSPELFISKSGDQLTAKPMKGTCKRGRTVAEDDERSEGLRSSEKERAENLMIVDLLRNDLSKVAQNGSVNVSKLYNVEKYRTLFTMTSTIEAKMSEKHSAFDVMMSIFPCGSVTGAPKIRAQEIISELEDTQRGIYTGAIGYIGPDGDMCFSVPIRTITIKEEGRGEMGIGGAIVADSKAHSEYDECLLKARFLTGQFPKFDLIESMKWSSETGIEAVEMHLDRLEKSAMYFAFFMNRDDIFDALQEHVGFLITDSVNSYKIRLLLSRAGSISISSERLSMSDDNRKPKVAVSNFKIDKNDPMYFHKTTQRDLYRREFGKYKDNLGCFDVLFMNENDEVTEGSFTNIFVKKNEVYYTPPIDCGLLSGIYRQTLIDDPDIKTKEKLLYFKDLLDADKIFLCNSVRGLVEVQLIEL